MSTIFPHKSFHDSVNDMIKSSVKEALQLSLDNINESMEHLNDIIRISDKSDDISEKKNQKDKKSKRRRIEERLDGIESKIDALGLHTAYFIIPNELNSFTIVNEFINKCKKSDFDVEARVHETWIKGHISYELVPGNVIMTKITSAIIVNNVLCDIIDNSKKYYLKVTTNPL